MESMLKGFSYCVCLYVHHVPRGDLSGGNLVKNKNEFNGRECEQIFMIKKQAANCRQVV